MKTRLLTLPLLALLGLCLSCTSLPYEKYDQQAIKAQWEDEIRAFEEMDDTRSYLPGSILFAGSSSIRLWDSIHTDMHPYPVIRRGYGGAAMHDFAYYAERILKPHDYGALVLFVGNDIWGNEEDKKPSEIVRLFKYVIGLSQDYRPDAPVFIIDIRPIPSRWSIQEKVEAENKALEKMARNTKGVYFISTSDAFLDPQGQIREGLYGPDSLHLNRKGYKIWTGEIKNGIFDVLKEEEKI